VRKIERFGVNMKNAINELRLQLNYVCYENGMSEKLSGVWDAFFKLEEAFNSSHNTQKPSASQIADKIEGFYTTRAHLSAEDVTFLEGLCQQLRLL
jgi:hypothetical protein